MMSMDYIRKTYGVPAKRGGRIAYGCEGIGLRCGTIIGSRGAYLRIRLDGETVTRNYHPDWNMVYMTPNALGNSAGACARPVSAANES